MKKQIILFIISTFLQVNLVAQKVEWPNMLTCDESIIPSSISVDPSNNVYITGKFSGTADFDPGPNVAELSSKGASDGFIVKLDAQGGFQWAKRFGGRGGEDIGNDVVTDSLGNVFVVGEFQSDADFDSITISATALADSFVLKLNSSGDISWLKQLNGSDIVISTAITLTSSVDLLITGRFKGSPNFFNRKVSTYGNYNNYDIFALKMDSAGNVLWAKQQGGSGEDSSESITTDSLGNVFIAGYYYSTSKNDPEIGQAKFATSKGYDIFVMKLNNQGEFCWTHTFGGNHYDYGHSIATDHLGNIVVAGEFAGLVDFDPDSTVSLLASYNIGSETDAFVLKLDNSGKFLWVKQFGGLNSDYGSSVVTDHNGNIYLAGDFWEKAYFGDYELNAGDYIDYRDVYVLKLDKSGNTSWVRHIGGKRWEEGQAIEVGQDGSVFITGNFEGTIDTNTGYLREEAKAEKYNDTFVFKLESCPINIVRRDTVAICDSYTWINGKTYTQSDDSIAYSEVDMNGCGLTYVLNLTILNSTTIDSVVACDSYTWQNGITYSESTNSPTHTLTNQHGCDSVINLHLSIFSTTIKDEISACDAYTWIDGTTYTESTDTPRYVFTNVVGCETVATLDLRINHPTRKADTVSNCGPFTWVDGVTYFESTNAPVYALTNTMGCDSLMTLNLIVNAVDTSVTMDEYSLVAGANGAAYQWLDCWRNYLPISGETSKVFTPEFIGSYAVVVTENGCVDTSLCVPVAVVGIVENSISDELTIYPNPTDGDVSISLGTRLQDIDVVVLDMEGRIVLTEKFVNTDIIDFSLSGSSGVYIIKLADQKGKSAVIRVIKQ
ncbi:SBBP repeat-containing protein [Flammeovirgaceae bacterium SG7u.111]|nr:SBBP repeat-containing protein [Flammeovirgaceae bacterium SG7u.132]WPO36990.1 SBBP repeat-containing protein [Flammeovirgaceae bacterium SG7u.111]